MNPPASYSRPEASTATARTSTSPAARAAGDFTSKSNVISSSSCSSRNGRGGTAGQPRGSSSRTSPVVVSREPFVTATVNRRARPDADGQTSVSGSILRSSRGTTVSGRRTSPTAWSRYRNVTSRGSIRFPNSAVRSGSPKGTPRRSSGASDQSYRSPIRG